MASGPHLRRACNARARVVPFERPAACIDCRVTGPLRWLAFESLVLSLLLGGFFLAPFAHLWGTLPTQAAASAASAQDGSWLAPLTVALLFGIPSLLPFLVSMRRPSAHWMSRTPLPLVALAAAVGFVLLPAAVSLATYPCCTSDVLDYVNRQRLWAVYGGNPFAVTPNQFPDDWTYAFTNLREVVVPYGPAWWLLTRLFTQGARTLDQYLVAFKALAAVCFVCSLALIWLQTEPGERLTSLIFFAWSPVVLIDGLVRVHNDLLTVPFVLVAFWLWRRRRSASALTAVMVGALVKVTVGPVCLPLVLDLLRRRQWRTLGWATTASLLITAILYGPFWFGFGTLASLFSAATRGQWSVGTLLLSALQPALGSASQPVVRLALVAIGGGVVVACLRRRAPTLASTGAAVLLVVLLVVPLVFYSHYLMPVIALAAVASDARLRSVVLAISFGSLVNAVLGVDSLVGGLAGPGLDLVGSGVLCAALAVALLQVWLATRRIRSVAAVAA
jgi:hypothetical protein